MEETFTCCSHFLKMECHTLRKINRLQRLISEQGELVFIIEDENGSRFGGFLSVSFEIREKFYGNGECFLFDIKKDGTNYYPASLLNDLFFFSDEDGFGFGSEEHYGLFIDKSLRKGSSYHCKTYNNETLSTKNHFTPTKLEVWGFNKPKD